MKIFYQPYLIAFSIAILLWAQTGVAIHHWYCLCTDRLETHLDNTPQLDCHNAETKVCCGKDQTSACAQDGNKEHKSCDANDFEWLKLDTELLHAVQYFEPFELPTFLASSPTYFTFLALSASTHFSWATNFSRPPPITGWRIRIALQSFLC